VDVIIAGRGGGSIEDLWAFNEEIVARTVFNCNTPIISAVGHETDYTIIDFVSDMRAPTPSAAAELAVPNVLTVKNDLNKNILSIEKMLITQIQGYRKQLDMLSASRVLTSKESLLDEYKIKIGIASDKLDIAMDALLKDKKHNYGILCAKLNAISPLNTLSRGYAIIQNDKGHALVSVNDVKAGDSITVSVSDGNFSATVN
jgi:exodeoxyribonuclease VII large subunit